MIYQLRLEAVKMFFHDRGEDCDDTRASTIELTEAEYLSARIEWCNNAVWAWFSKYWTSDEYKEKRRRAQEARMSSEDPAQNRGGSRNFTETQQFLEYTFGPGHQSGTINTLAVMMSRIKNVDSTGRSGPIPSHKAQKRLDDYKALAPDENSKVFDGKALYIMGRGMPHGRVLIGNGAVKKASVLVHAKSTSVMPPNHDEYQSVIAENEQLKETNELLIEENSVHRDLVMRIYADFNKQPPADLLQRLTNIDARRNQTTRSSHGGSVSVDNDWYNNNYNDDEEDDDYTIEGANEDDYVDEEDCTDHEDDYVDEEDCTDHEADEEDMLGDDALHHEVDHDDIYREANNLHGADWELDDDDHLTDHARSKKNKVARSGTRHGNTNGSK